MAAAVLLCLTLDRNISSSSSVVLLSCSFSPVGGASCTGTSRKSTLNWQYIIFNIWYLFLLSVCISEKNGTSAASRSVLMQLTVSVRTSCQMTALIISALIQILHETLNPGFVSSCERSDLLMKIYSNYQLPSCTTHRHCHPFKDNNLISHVGKRSLPFNLLISDLSVLHMQK